MKKKRDTERVFVAEGKKLVSELLNSFDCLYIAATSDWKAANASTFSCVLGENADFIFDEVTEEELSKISFLDTPQQVLAIFRQPHYSYDVANVAMKNLCLALDDVQNPGNLGTIVRVADWFGIRDIFCSRGCADIYNPKCVQATMGALARVKLHYGDLETTLSGLPKDVPVYGTFLNGENMYSKNLTGNGIIVMGNEGKGISEPIEKLITEKLYIPNYPQGEATSESLNVSIATAIVCSEFRRRQL